MKENFGKTLYVLSVRKNVGFILYDNAKGLLPYITDFFAYYFNIIYLLYDILTSVVCSIYKIFFSKLYEGIIFIPRYI